MVKNLGILSRFNAALIDVDGTLISTSKLHNRAFLQTLAYAGYTSPFSYESFAGMTTEHVFRSLGFSEENVEKLTKMKRNFASLEKDQVTEMPGATRFLQNLKVNGLGIFVVTSGSFETVERNLKTTGLNQYIDGGIFSEDVKMGKPNPECYLAALSKFSLDVKCTFAVEDSLAGCLSAIHAGLFVIGVGNSNLPSHRNITSLEEI